MPRADGELESAVTLLLADQAPELAAAHDELYPERVSEQIPLSLTLLYPFAPPSSLDAAQLDALREFFASRPPVSFELTHVSQWDSGGVYAVPEPEGPVRDTMRALWRLFPQFPPYGVVDGDPPPHASLTLGGEDDPASSRARVEQRLQGLLPVRFDVGEASLIEEYEPDRWRVLESFSFAQDP